MKLINCPACSKKVSVQAKSCPTCGQPVKSQQNLGYVAGMFLIAVILIYFLWDIFCSMNAVDRIK